MAIGPKQFQPKFSNVLSKGSSSGGGGDKQGKTESSGDVYSMIKSKASSLGDDSDSYKYQAAVDLAKNKAGENVSDRDLRGLIEDEYQKLDPTMSASEVRGETPFSSVIRGAKEGIDDFNRFVGSGMDQAFDNTIGNIGSAIGQGDSWKNAFDGDDLAAVSDTLLDVGLAAIPYAGIPLVAAKNMVQQSDNLYEGFTGRDSLTGRKLEGNQQGGKLASGLIGSALGFLPGAGKAVNLGKSAIPALAESAAKETGKVASAKAAASTAADIAKSEAKGAKDSILGRIVGPANAAKEAGKSGGSRIGAAYEALNEAPLSPDSVRSLSSSMRKIAKDSEKNAAREGMSGGQKVLDSAKSAAKNLPLTAARQTAKIGSSLGGGVLGTMGEYGVSPDEALGIMGESLLEGNAPSVLLPMIAPTGATRMARNLGTPNMTGTSPKYVNSILSPEVPARAGSWNDAAGNMDPYAGSTEGTDDEDILTALANLGR